MSIISLNTPRMLRTSIPRYSLEGGRRSCPRANSETSSWDKVLPSMAVVACAPLSRETRLSLLAVSGMSGIPVITSHLEQTSPSRVQNFTGASLMSNVKVIHGWVLR